VKDEAMSKRRALWQLDLRIALRHILPNVVAPLIVQATPRSAARSSPRRASPSSAWAQQPARAELGSMLNTAKNYVDSRPGCRSGRGCRSSCWSCRSIFWAMGYATRSTSASMKTHVLLKIIFALLLAAATTAPSTRALPIKAPTNRVPSRRAIHGHFARLVGDRLSAALGSGGDREPRRRGRQHRRDAVAKSAPTATRCSWRPPA